MGTNTPLLSRIADRRDRRIGPVSPVPLTSRMSEFSKRLSERRLSTRDLTWYNGALTPTDDGGAA